MQYIEANIKLRNETDRSYSEIPFIIKIEGLDELTKENNMLKIALRS